MWGAKQITGHKTAFRGNLVSSVTNSPFASTFGEPARSSTNVDLVGSLGL